MNKGHCTTTLATLSIVKKNCGKQEVLALL